MDDMLTVHFVHLKFSKLLALTPGDQEVGPKCSPPGGAKCNDLPDSASRV